MAAATGIAQLLLQERKAQDYHASPWMHKSLVSYALWMLGFCSRCNRAANAHAHTYGTRLMQLRAR